MPFAEPHRPAAAAAPPPDASPLALVAAERVEAPVMVVAAHPDDESIGAGALLARCADARVVHVTDGAPLDPSHRGRTSDPARLAHAHRRRAEALAAMAELGLPPHRLHGLCVVDQEAIWFLAPLARALGALIARHRPAVVVTHAWEGGHPDHDATAFAVHAAVALARRDGSHRPHVVEMPCYHGADGAFVPQRFLPADVPALERPLTSSERALVANLFAAHASQQAVLAAFPADTERLRVAPAYDFARPPHPGALYYDRQGWGPGSARVCALARAAAAELNLGAPPWA